MLRLLFLCLLIAGCSSDSKNNDPDAGDTDTDTETDTGPLECSDLDTFDESQCPETYPSSSCVAYVDGDVASSGDGWGWDSAVKTVQEGIDLAYCGATIHGECEQWEVWVKAGTYYIHKGCREHTVRLRSNVALMGGFDGTETSSSERDCETNETILDGRNGPDGEEHVYHVVFARNENDVVLDGFTVTEGRADHETELVHQGGGGMRSESVSVAVHNCFFANNFALYGGGIDSWPFDEVHLSNCVFEGNEAGLYCGAGVFEQGDLVQVDQSIFRNNTSQKESGALCAWDTFLEVTDCEFVDNEVWLENVDVNQAGHAGAASVTGYGLAISNVLFKGNSAMGHGGVLITANCENVTICDCVFENNRALGGGGVIFLDSLAFDIYGSVFSDNQASIGGAIYNYQSDGLYSNCVFDGNKAIGYPGWTDGQTGAIFNVGGETVLEQSTFFGNVCNEENSGGALLVVSVPGEDAVSSMVVTDSIFWGNSIPPIVNEDILLSVTYSDIEGGYAGTGNIDADPMFVDPDAGDFCLQAGSPCIGAGDGGVDMGAPCPE